MVAGIEQDQAAGHRRDHLLTALDLVEEGVLSLDAELRVVGANAAARRILGLTSAQLRRPRWWELVRPRRSDGTAADFEAAMRAPARDVAVRIRRPSDGRSRRLLVQHAPLPGGGTVVTFRDRTEEERTSARLASSALRDRLTGLPNRAAAVAEIERAMAAPDTPFALLLVDIDAFHAVNTSVGQAAGDAVLREAAGRLRGVLPREARAARFGADDFAVVAPAADEAAARAVAERIGDAFAAPFVAGQGAHLSASVGVALGDAARDAAGVIAAAEAALGRAKARGRGLVHVFDDELRRSTADRLALTADLRAAIDADALSLVYQPIVEISNGTARLVAIEALARWDHPQRGAIPPDRFVVLAENAGLVRSLGRRVLARACLEVAALRRDHPDTAGSLRLSVNVSARQIASGLLEHDVRAALGASGLPPQALSLELTETALMEDGGARIDPLLAVRDVGVRLFLDDFGTGYSSLARLRRLPLDGLKIDRSFVAGLGAVRVDGAIVEAILTMAQALELPVVAEGVETRDQARILRSLGCPLAQGYLHGRPMPLEQLRDRLARGAGPGPLQAVRAGG